MNFESTKMTHQNPPVQLPAGDHQRAPLLQEEEPNKTKQLLSDDVVGVETGISGMESFHYDRDGNDKRLAFDNEGNSLHGRPENSKHDMYAEDSKEEADDGRERLKKHRIEMAGRVWIPEIWGQEELLKDWIDCSAFDASLVPSGIMSARAALVQEGRRANSSRIRVENRC